MNVPSRFLSALIFFVPFAGSAATTNDTPSHNQKPWEQFAQITDPDAQYRLGCDLYQRGDAKAAVHWCQLAAEQGHKWAQLSLGFSYRDGDGVLKNYSEAVKWFRRAAEQGLPEGQFALGGCYHNGDGVSQNYKMAARWYRRAAEQGLVDAQLNLGILCYNGRGVPQDYGEAIRWYRQAAEQGALQAQCYLSVIYSEGVAVPRDDKEAFKWSLCAAQQGDPDMQNNLAVLYHNGQGVLEDYVEAYAWFSIAAMNGSTLGMNNRDGFKRKMTSSQIAAGQERAKELQAMIERKKQVAELGEDEVPAAEIAPSGFGSGLLVDGGFVLTCWHVVDGGDKISISCNGKNYAASVVQKDPANDIAVLRVADAPEGVSLSLTDSKLGANVFTMGFPHPDLQGVDVKFTTGSISGLTGPENTPLYYQISAPIQSGNSGGPLFDEKGNLVGMVAAKLDSLVTLAATGDLPQNVNYAIKADYLRPLLKTVDGISIQPAQTEETDLLSLIDELKKSVVMIKVY